MKLLGSSNNVTVADGLVTSNNLVTTNLTFAGVTLPTTDGTANQILVIPTISIVLNPSDARPRAPLCEVVKCRVVAPLLRLSSSCRNDVGVPWGVAKFLLQ